MYVLKVEPIRLVNGMDKCEKGNKERNKKWFLDVCHELLRDQRLEER